MVRFTYLVNIVYILYLYVGVYAAMQVTYHSATGNAYSLRPSTPFKLSPSNGKRSSVLLDDLNRFFNIYDHFKVRNVHSQLQHRSTTQDPHNENVFHSHFSQVHNGVPVIGSFVKVHTSEDNIEFVNGAFVPDITTDTTPRVPKEVAELAAMHAVYNKYNLRLSATRPLEGLKVKSSDLSFYHTGLARGISGKVQLVYDIMITHEERDNFIRERLIIDANTASVIEQFSTISNLLHRNLWYYAYNHGAEFTDREGVLVWREGEPLPEDSKQQQLLNTSELVYNVFQNLVGWDSYDNQGAQMNVVFNLSSESMCPNAAWTGDSIVLCPNFDGLDIVVHEWTHAYTMFMDAVFYQYESGALNEAYSDILGETIQILTNYPVYYPPRTSDACINISNTESSKRWILWDDINNIVPLIEEYPFMEPYRNGIRDMYNPNCIEHSEGQVSPRSTYDPNYITSNYNNGGVHANSGVINQGYSLLVDGGLFNGTSVTGIGAIKAIHIYIRAKSVYQGPLTTFSQHADAIITSCSDLIGLPLKDPISGAISGETISSADCVQVENIIIATGLRYKPNYDDLDLPEILEAIPRYQHVYKHGRDYFEWPTITFEAVEFDYYLVWTAIAKIEGSISGLLYAECNTPINTSIVCMLPVELSVPQTLTVSVKVGEFSEDGTWSDPYTVTLFENAVISSVEIIEQGNTILVTGSGFQQFEGCVGTNSYNLDVFENPFDCLLCIVGNPFFGPYVAATLINSTAISCPVPPEDSLLEDYDELKVFVATSGPTTFQFAGRVPLPYCASGLEVIIKQREDTQWYQDGVLHRIFDISVYNTGATTVTQILIEFHNNIVIDNVNKWNLDKVQDNVYSFSLYGIQFGPGQSLVASSGFIFRGDEDVSGSVYSTTCA